MDVIKLDPNKEMPVIGIRILEKQYVEDFVKKGIVHFSSPSVWTDEHSKSGHQLDIYEGCFCYSTEEHDECFNKLGRKFKKVKDGNAFRYYEKTSRLKACCFYGLNKSKFTPAKAKYGVKDVVSLDAHVSKEYFDRFNEQNIENKKVVLILSMPVFLCKVRSTLFEMGCKAQDIFLFPVYYVNKRVPFFSKEPFPFEYYLKDSQFQEQSEFRILINCKDDVFWEQFERANFNLFLGDISNIARVQDYYQGDLAFSIQGDKLLFELATPEITKINELPFKELVGILYQTLNNRLPGEPLSEEEICIRVSKISEILIDRFGVKYCDDSRLDNVPASLFKELPEVFQRMCRGVIEDK